MAENQGPNWVDYANLYANYAQIRHLKYQTQLLHQLTEIERARQEKSDRISFFRQIVFDTEDRLHNLSYFCEKAPEGVYICLMILKQVYDEAGITPTNFDEFQDKERIKTLRSSIQIMTEKCFQILRENQRNELNYNLSVLYNMQDLSKIINGKKALEELEHTKDLWDSLSKKHNGRRFLFIFPFFIFALLGLISAVFLLTTLYGTYGYLSSLYAVLSVVIGGGAFLFSIISLIGIFAYGGPDEYKNLKNRRKYLSTQLVPKEELNRLILLFRGDFSSSYYEKIRDTFTDYMNRKITRDIHNEPLPYSLLDLTLPPKLLNPA